MKNIYKYIRPFAIIFCAMAIITVSCKDDETYGESPDLTYIKNIKILNGGLTGDSVIIGKVDEINKEITFPKLNELTDLSKVEFAAELPTGAKFDKETYNFSINVAEGETQSKQVISVVNGKRKREYNATIRLKVPAFGADFSEVKKYEFFTYPDLSAANTRNLDLDTTYVLIAARVDAATSRIHLLRISDLKTGKTDDPIMLDLTGVAGGTFTVSSGHLSHGHIYAVNLASDAGELSIYHWQSPSAAPTKVFAQIPTTFGVTGGRFGDDMSMDLNEDGDGYIFLGNNQSVTTSNRVLRIKVTAFTILSEPTILTMPVGGGMWSNCNLVDGTDEYVYTGPSGGIALVGVGGSPIYTMADNGTTFTRAADAHIVSYNEKRYLGLTTGNPGSGGENAMYIYDITKGTTTKEALEMFDAGSKPYEYRHSLTGGGNGSVYCASFAFAKAAKSLYILGGAPYGGGFVVLEVPIATDEDNFYNE